MLGLIILKVTDQHFGSHRRDSNNCNKLNLGICPINPKKFGPFQQDYCDNRFFPRESPKGKYGEESMREWKSLSHVRWDCKYHIVFVSKCRQEAIYGNFRKKIGSIIRDLCGQKGIELLEGHRMPDHIHLCRGGLHQTTRCAGGRWLYTKKEIIIIF